MRDYYAGLDVRFAGNWHHPDKIRRGYSGAAHFQFTASPNIPAEYRERYKTWHQYESALYRDDLDNNPWPEGLMKEPVPIISDTPRWTS